MSPRSYLYVPGHRADRFGKAESSGADGVIFDLEDAVPLTLKREARDAVVEWLETPVMPAVERWVRVNAGDLGLDDVTSLVRASIRCGLVIPKATPDVLRALTRTAPDHELIPLIESAAALGDLDQMLRRANVRAAAMGEVDLAADLGVSASADPAVWWSIRTSVVVASVAAGCGRPIGPIDPSFDDPASLSRETRQLKAGGFAARQAIHPDQVPIINEVFTATNEERASARRLVELADAAGGGVCVDDDGRMIDEAVLRSARRLLDESELHAP